MADQTQIENVGYLGHTNQISRSQGVDLIVICSKNSERLELQRRRRAAGITLGISVRLLYDEMREV